MSEDPTEAVLDPVVLLERWFLYPNVLLAGTSACWSFCVEQLLGIDTDPAVLALSFLLTLVTYNRDRLADAGSQADALNMEERTRWIVQNRQFLEALTLGSGSLAVVLLLLRPGGIAPVVLGIGFALVYSSPILPEHRALRQLPGLKVPYVALLWTLLTVVLPVCTAGATWGLKTTFAALVVFYSAAALVNLNDIRDVRGDQRAGTLTLPVLLGERTARWVSVGLALNSVLFAIALGHPALWLVGVYIAFLALAYEEAKDRLFRWLIEGVGLLSLAAVLLF